MKKKVSVLAIFVIVVSLCWAFVSCATNDDIVSGEPNNEPKSIVITGFDLDIQPEEMGAFLLWDWERGSPAGGGASRDGDTLTIELRTGDGGVRVPWTGTGEYFLLFEVRPGINGGEYTRWVYQDWAILAINKAVTTVRWSDFGETD